MKRLFPICLVFVLIFAIMIPCFINPSRALAIEVQQSARVVSTVGDGLRYYVVFEYKGTQYRSDEMGPGFNANMWNMLNEADRKKVAFNFAFAPGYRTDQFGTAGSAAITDWSNEVSGWKAAGEEWEKAIGAREYPELAAFFTGSGYYSMKVGDDGFDDVKTELQHFSAETKKTMQYQSAVQLTLEIGQEYAAGQAIYEKLAETKATQVGNAFKAGSEVLLKDVIIDNIMLPAITPSASKASELIADCIFFVKDRIMDMYDQLQGEPDAPTILKAMQDVLDKLAETDNGIKADITSKLEQLNTLMITLRDFEQQKNVEKAQSAQEKITTVNENADTVFSWSDEKTTYAIPSPSSEMTEAEYDEKKSQVLNEASLIKAEFDTVLADILGRKHEIYGLLEYNDEQVLTNHPSFEQKYRDKLWVDSIVELPYEVIGLDRSIDPAAHFSAYYPYSETKAAIATGGDTVNNDWAKSIRTLEDYIQQAEDFIADQSLTLTDSLNSIEAKVNGLEILYAMYIGGDLKSYVFGPNSPETVQTNLELMLSNEGLPDFYGAYGTDYRILSMMQEEKAQSEKVLTDFATDSPVFEADLAQAAAGYDSLYTNLQNSATFMYGAYLDRKDLYKNSPYFKFYQPETQGENVPIIDQLYINTKIAEAPEDQKETVINGIISELRDLKTQELNLMHRINTGKTNCQYDALQLDRLLQELGVYNNDTAYKNLKTLIGKDITDSWRYLAKNDDVQRLYLGLHILNYSDISQVLEGLEGTSDAYYKCWILADEIAFNANDLRALNDEAFEIKFTEYKTELENSMTSTYAMNLLQSEKAWAEHNRGVQMLEDLKEERCPTSTEVLVDSITPVFAGTLTSATSIGMNVGDTCQLEAIISPSNATNQQVFWDTYDPNIATVNSQGLVSAVAEGDATITITSTDGSNILAVCRVKVNGPYGGGQVTHVEITGPTQIVIPGSSEDTKTITYSAIVKDQNGNELPGEMVSWSLEEWVQGVSINNNTVTITSEAEAGTAFTMIASSDTDIRVTGKLTVNLIDLDECFIATAAFGSKLSPAVTLLRQFRDTILLTNTPGQAFVNFYYTHSPSVAKIISGNEGLKVIVRILLLPVIILAWAIMNFEVTLIILMLLTVYLVIRYRKIKILE